jgi:hypothetical protein
MRRIEDDGDIPSIYIQRWNEVAMDCVCRFKD